MVGGKASTQWGVFPLDSWMPGVRSGISPCMGFLVCDNYILARRSVCHSLAGVGGEVTAPRLFLQDFLNPLIITELHLMPQCYIHLLPRLVLKPLFSGDLIIESSQFARNYSTAPTESCASASTSSSSSHHWQAEVAAVPTSFLFPGYRGGRGWVWVEKSPGTAQGAASWH